MIIELCLKTITIFTWIWFRIFLVQIFLPKFQIFLIQSRILGGYLDVLHIQMHGIHFRDVACVEKVQVLQHVDVELDDDPRILLDQDEEVVQVMEVALFCLWQLHHGDVHEHVGWAHDMVCRDCCIRNRELHLHIHLCVHI